MKNFKLNAVTIWILSSLLSSVLSCTGQLPGSFRFQQKIESFSANQLINTKIDLLWVIGNSASLDVSQQRLRAGMAAFAQKYMQPTWDIRVAAITTDTYLANPAFSGYLGKTVNGSVGYVSPHIQSRLSTFVNPSYNTSLVNLSTGAFTNGIKFGEIIPAWGPSYAKLLPGMHDGPISALCFEGMPYFLNSTTTTNIFDSSTVLPTKCAIRDNQAAYSGPADCINPTASENSISQCVNTVQNNTVRSGKAIISTIPPSGIAADVTWKNQLVNDFIVNLSVGSAGQGSQRGFLSVMQLLTDNEVASSTTSFFRPGSLRGIIFVTTQDDQSMQIPSSPPATYSPDYGYKCDQASLTAMNGAANTSGANGYCCSTPGNNCQYGSAGTSCSSKTVDSHTYTVSVCADPATLIPVATVKTTLDSFFTTLDGNSAGNPNYFVASIVPLTGVGIQTLQGARDALDAAIGTRKTVAIDKGDRYIALGNLVGNGSLALDVASADFTPVLNAIGQNLIAQKSKFTLSRAPTGQEDMLVTITQAGSTFNLKNSQYSVSGNTLTITDQDLVLSLGVSDSISINYQPKSL